MENPEQELKKDLRLAIIIVVAIFVIAVAALLLVIRSHGNAAGTATTPKKHITPEEKIGENITEMAREIAPIGETYKRMKEYSDTHGGIIETGNADKADSKGK